MDTPTENENQIAVPSGQDPTPLTVNIQGTATSAAAQNSISAELVGQMLAQLRTQQEQLQIQSRQQQELIQTLLEAVRTNISNNNVQTESVRPHIPLADSAALQASSPSTSTQSRTNGTSTVATAQAVKLITMQLPDFDGADSSDVELWLNRVEKVASLHGASAEVTFLAASSKLVKNAKRWFDTAPDSILESRLTLKSAIVSRFKTHFFHQSVMQKVENRKWAHSKESFKDYALDKVCIMRALRLSDTDAIKYLISGINSVAIRGVAASLTCNTIDDFLYQMQQITSSCTDMFKKPSTSIHNQKDHQTGKPSKSLSSTPGAETGTKDTFCVYCRKRGHTKAECYKLKNRESSSAAKKTTVAAVAQGISETEAEKETTVAVIAAGLTAPSVTADQGSFVKISRLDNKQCICKALCDTGSDISLMSSGMFERSIKKERL